MVKLPLSKITTIRSSIMKFLLNELVHVEKNSIVEAENEEAFEAGNYEYIEDLNEDALESFNISLTEVSEEDYIKNYKSKECICQDTR